MEGGKTYYIVCDNVKCVQDIVLSQSSSIINDQSDVYQEFNNFFNQVAESIGQHPRGIFNYQNDDGLDYYVEDVIRTHSSHPSMAKLRETIVTDSFKFHKVPLMVLKHVLKG